RGEHRYYRHPGNAVPNRAKVVVNGHSVALDVRGDGGLVVAPYSVHRTGVLYQPSPQFGAEPLEVLPVFQVGLLQGHPQGLVRSPRPESPASSAIVDLARAELASWPVPEIGDGSDHAVFTAACRLVRGFGLSQHQAAELLWEWCGNRVGW